MPSGRAGPGGLGGGIASTSTASLTNVTVAGNFGGAAGDGVLAAGGVLSEYGSLIAGNGGSGGQNCAGAIVNRGANITYPAQSTSACPGVVADPKLGALGAHGGGVATIALRPGSAAIDAEPSGAAVSRNRRARRAAPATRGVRRGCVRERASGAHTPERHRDGSDDGDSHS